MKCPKCQASEWKTLETRRDDERNAYRRRKQCIACGERITTLEQPYVSADPPPPSARTPGVKKKEKEKKPRAKAVLKNRVKAMFELEKKRDRAYYDVWSPDNDFISDKY